MIVIISSIIGPEQFIHFISFSFRFFPIFVFFFSRLIANSVGLVTYDDSDASRSDSDSDDDSSANTSGHRSDDSEKAILVEFSKIIFHVIFN